jgi:hypothetical protein
MVQPKYSPEEALQRVKLMMGYDMKKTLKENREIILEQTSAGDASAIAKELWGYMAGDVETSDLQKVQNLLDTKVFGKTYKDGCLLNKVLEYYKGHQGSFAWSLTTTYHTGGFLDDLAHSDESGEPEFEDIKKDITDSINKELSSFCKTTTTTTTTTGKTTTDTTKPKQAPAIPTELKDVEGVKKFQDWLDTNKASWATGYPNGVLNKAGGYGSFGPRTSKAWASYGQEYLKGGTTPTVTKAVVTPGEQGVEDVNNV